MNNWFFLIFFCIGFQLKVLAITHTNDCRYHVLQQPIMRGIFQFFAFLLQSFTIIYFVAEDRNKTTNFFHSFKCNAICEWDCQFTIGISFLPGWEHIWGDRNFYIFQLWSNISHGNYLWDIAPKVNKNLFLLYYGRSLKVIAQTIRKNHFPPNETKNRSFHPPCKVE